MAMLHWDTSPTLLRTKVIRPTNITGRPSQRHNIQTNKQKLNNDRHTID